MRQALFHVSVLAILLTFPAAAQVVPEGIHSVPSGPSKLCGLVATTTQEFEAQVAALPNIITETGTDQYKVYTDEARFTQWAFARKGNHAYQLATCREIVEMADGSVGMNRNLHCEDTRENCDSAFREFQALDEQARQALRSKIGS